jgi:hypothetical protein
MVVWLLQLQLLLLVLYILFSFRVSIDLPHCSCCFTCCCCSRSSNECRWSGRKDDANRLFVFDVVDIVVGTVDCLVTAPDAVVVGNPLNVHEFGCRLLDWLVGFYDWIQQLRTVIYVSRMVV